MRAPGRLSSAGRANLPMSQTLARRTAGHPLGRFGGPATALDSRSMARPRLPTLPPAALDAGLALVVTALELSDLLVFNSGNDRDAVTVALLLLSSVPPDDPQAPWPALRPAASMPN